MKTITHVFLPLLCAVLHGVVAERSVSEVGKVPHPHLPHTDELIHEYESKLTKQLRPWQRRYATRVGPVRKSLQSRANAIEQTRRVIETHNANKSFSYRLDWNELSDLSDEEYRGFLRSLPLDVHQHTTRRYHPRQRLHSPSTPKSATQNITVNFEDEPNWDDEQAKADGTNATTGDTTPLPKNWNWLEIENGKYITPIKNQGTCGSCWAFSAVSVIESRYAIQHNVTATPLSVEQVLSCSAPLDHIHSKFANMIASSQGCDGGMPFLAYEYMSRVTPNGIACAATYPYVMATSTVETQCQAVASNEVAVAWENGKSDYVAIDAQSEEALMRAVYSGPVSANIDAMGAGFRHYGSGIYDANDCLSDGQEVNHAVVIVGYGETEQGDKYWVVRNTWGTMWGENGYIRIARGKPAHQPNGPCNLHMYATYPVGLNDGAAHGATCRIETTRLEPLGTAALMSLDLKQWASFTVLSLALVMGGMAIFVTSEMLRNRRDATDGGPTYEQNYARWILPTKEQIAIVLARRRAQGDGV